MKASHLRDVGIADAIDIYAAERERILAKDWSAVHVAGDRAKPLPEWWGKRR